MKNVALYVREYAFRIGHIVGCGALFLVMLLLGGVVYVSRFLTNLVCNIMGQAVFYWRNPRIAIVDIVSAYRRMDRWSRVTLVSFTVANTTWADDWVGRLRIETDGGPQAATIILSSQESRAVATMYKTSEMPTLADLEEMLGTFLLTRQQVQFGVRITGREKVFTTCIVIDLHGKTAKIGGGPAQRISFNSLSLDSLVDLNALALTDVAGSSSADSSGTDGGKKDA